MLVPAEPVSNGIPTFVGQVRLLERFPPLNGAVPRPRGGKGPIPALELLQGDSPVAMLPNAPPVAAADRKS